MRERFDTSCLRMLFPPPLFIHICSPSLCFSLFLSLSLSLSFSLSLLFVHLYLAFHTHPRPNAPKAAATSAHEEVQIFAESPSETPSVLSQNTLSHTSIFFSFYQVPSFIFNLAFCCQYLVTTIKSHRDIQICKSPLWLVYAFPMQTLTFNLAYQCLQKSSVCLIMENSNCFISPGLF